MSQLGMGVMIRAVFGSREAVDTSLVLGKRIASVEATSDAFVLEVTDGHRLRITDEGQSCCENRYMTCDDDLSTYVGATLVSIEVAEGPDVAEGEYGDSHETQFLRVSTDLGTIVVCTHNEHNGYYGGFALDAQVLPPNGKDVA